MAVVSCCITGTNNYVDLYRSVNQGVQNGVLRQAIELHVVVSAHCIILIPNIHMDNTQNALGNLQGAGGGPETIKSNLEWPYMKSSGTCFNQLRTRRILPCLKFRVTEAWESTEAKNAIHFEPHTFLHFPQSNTSSSLHKGVTSSEAKKAVFLHFWPKTKY